MSTIDMGDEPTASRSEDPPHPTTEEEALNRYGWLADTIARKFQVRHADRADLRQVAMIGLLMAFRRFDDSRGVKFQSYASRVIIGHIKHYFRDQRWNVRVSRQVKDDWLAIRLAIDVLTQELGATPSIGEISDFTSLPEERVLDAMRAGATFRTLPVSAPSAANGGDERGIDLPSRDRSIDRLDEALTVRAAVGRLNGDDRELVDLAMWKELTQTQIGDRLGVSQMTVSRRLRTVYGRLGAWLVTTDAG